MESFDIVPLVESYLKGGLTESYSSNTKGDQSVLILWERNIIIATEDNWRTFLKPIPIPFFASSKNGI